MNNYFKNLTLIFIPRNNGNLLHWTGHGNVSPSGENNAGNL